MTYDFLKTIENQVARVSRIISIGEEGIAESISCKISFRQKGMGPWSSLGPGAFDLFLAPPNAQNSRSMALPKLGALELVTFWKNFQKSLSLCVQPKMDFNFCTASVFLDNVI
jgi:hypothetical protein